MYVWSSHPAVGVQQTAGDDAVQKGLVGCYDVVQILGLLHLVPQLVPGALQHLHTHTKTNNTLINLHLAPSVTVDMEMLC